jgi:hypothetical protein
MGNSVLKETDSHRTQVNILAGQFPPPNLQGGGRVEEVGWDEREEEEGGREGRRREEGGRKGREI